jgi:hypothetical protein
VDADVDADADQDLITVRARLRAALEGAHGRLRATDAIRLAGFKRRTYLRALLVARSMRELGWDQARCRFNGTLETAYARGSGLEREIILDVERGTDGQLTVKAKEP